MNEQPLSLRTSLREIWRRRVLILVVAVLCAAAGAAYGYLRPTTATAGALVILPQTANSGSGVSGISTEVVIAKSTPVLAGAGAKLSPRAGSTRGQETGDRQPAERAGPAD